ncbi:hypothetical protein MMC11_005702 [Xylographa trunciseda]|nr:hypothetical protein [Xylographa trunciseda]
MLDQLVGLAMLIAATTVFLYYTTWTLLMVRFVFSFSQVSAAKMPCEQPFVDPGHPLHDLFPPRVWAIRIPVILILLGSAVVGSFLSVVMIRSNRKKAVKTKLAAGKKKA